jgi:tetratricopeptide (TPR) repeat protein
MNLTSFKELCSKWYNQLGNIVTKEKAIEYYSNAISASPQVSTYYLNRAFAYLENDEIFNATLDVNEFFLKKLDDDDDNIDEVLDAYKISIICSISNSDFLETKDICLRAINLAKQFKKTKERDHLRKCLNKICYL